MHQEDDRESKRGDGQKGTGMFVMFDKNYVFSLMSVPKVLRPFETRLTPHGFFGVIREGFLGVTTRERRS